MREKQRKKYRNEKQILEKRKEEIKPESKNKWWEQERIKSGLSKK